jgi:hypothetical protein
MYDMINIFEVFLPQLLRYPNPTDPLNGEAAALLMREPKSYDAKVKGMHATNSVHTRWADRILPQSMFKSMPTRTPPKIQTRTTTMTTR